MNTAYFSFFSAINRTVFTSRSKPNRSAVSIVAVMMAAAALFLPFLTPPASGAIAFGENSSFQRSDISSSSDSRPLLEMIGLKLAREGHTATALQDGRILMAGGENESEPIRQTEMFDPKSSSFSAGAMSITAHSGHTAILRVR